MARGHGRILTSIWEDQDFLALTQQQQRLYLFLISQPNLNHAGLLPLTLRRWSRKAAGLAPAELETHLHALADAQFIVMDEDTEELLIRSFVRNDGVWKQPKVMGAMVSGALEISSPLLRRALLDEMDRVPLDDLSDEPTKSTRGPGPSIRVQVAEHIDVLRRAFGTPEPTPGGHSSTSPSVPPSDAPADGGREGSTRARARVPLPLSPAPTPVPSPEGTPPNPPAGEHTPRPAVTQTGEKPMPDRMTDAFLDRYRTGNAYNRRQVRRIIADALTNGTDPGELWQALERIGSASKPVSAGTLQFAFAEIRKPGNVIQLPTGHTLTGTDAKVAGWAAVAAQLRNGDSA